jgi:acyl carrier protein
MFIELRYLKAAIEPMRNFIEEGGMTRDEILNNILKVFEEEFEIADPGLDDDLREMHGFDSIDAIELLREIEDMLGFELTQEQKKRAMDNILTLNQILDYVEGLRPEPA